MANRAKCFMIASAFLAFLSINFNVMGQSDANLLNSIDKPYVTAEMITLPTVDNVAIYKLTVKGPDNYHYETEFTGENVPFIDTFGLHGELLGDGLYGYQLVLIPKVSEDAKDALNFARATGDMSEVDAMRKAGEIPAISEPIYGYFTIANGSILVPELEEQSLRAKNEGRSANDKPGDPVVINDDVKGDEGVIDNDSGIRDQVIADDLIVDGSACIGFDCVNGEVFGFDTIRLKENNLRIKFMDTSAGAFPTTDWQLTANDSAAGGASKFSIDDIDGGRTPFTVEANSPSHSLYVDNGGRVGFGTSIPVADLHVVSGNTPTLRLEQNGSSGFAPQTWDVAGNETNFFIRDASNGSTLPLRIRPGASSNAIYVDTDDDVGLGTASPDTALDVDGGTSDAIVKVQSSSGLAQFLAEHSGTTTSARREMFFLSNYGEPAFRFTNTDPAAADDWSMILLQNDSFLISRNGSGANEMQIFNGGDVTIAGSLTESSDVNKKENFEEVDAIEVLDRVVDMPISTWNYKHDQDSVRHMGPMAQDFAAAFGLGATNTGIANVDSTGVMFAAIKGLNQRIDEKEADLSEKDLTIQTLQKENAALQERLETLETTQDARIAELERLVKALTQSSNK